MNVKLVFVMTFLIGAATFVYADNEIYIDQVGAAATIEIVQDGTGNKLGGSTTDTTKMLLDGDSINFNVNLSGGANNIIGKLIGDTSTVDIDVDGSTNDLFFDVDKDNSFGATGGNYLIDITGSGNDLDFDFGSLDTANDTDFDFVLDGDFNAADINIDVSDVVFNMDVVSDNSNLLYNATGGDGHEFILTGVGNYWDIEVHQESILQSDSLEIEYEGSGTSSSDATICISQSDDGLNANCGN